MRVTSVRIVLPKSGSNPGIKAWARIELDGQLAIKMIRLIHKMDGAWILQFPHETRSEGGHFDVVHPVCHELRHHILESVYDAYRDHVQGKAPKVAS